MSHAVRRHPEAFTLSTTKKRPREKNEGHLAFIRTLPCIVTGKRPVEAAHIRYGDARYGKLEGSMGMKPHDRWTVPLHADEHRKQHSGDERAYWILAGIDPLQVASALWANTGDDEACELIIKAARAARTPSNV